MRALACLGLLLFACTRAREPDTAAKERPVRVTSEEGGAGEPESPPPAEGPSSTRDGDLNNAADAERALADDQRELDRLLAQPIASTTDAACRRVCAALASLRRSADAICRLSDEPARCDDAKKSVAKNERRVADAGCRC